MSVANPSAMVPQKKPESNEIRIVSHSNLFYWWPVWALALLLGMLTMIDGHYAAVLPSGSKPMVNVVGSGKIGDETIQLKEDEHREAWVLPQGQKLPRADDGKPEQTHLHMASRKGYGVLFCIILLIVIIITNVPLRGMWSMLVIMMIIALSIIFHLANWWEHILRTLSFLDVRINAAGYFVIGIALFGVWLITLLIFDQQIYMIFTPGQLKVCTEIGGGEKAYDTMGMTIEKQRSDLFRHWILGLGSGDLIVNTSGAQAHHFDLPNVLFVGRKVLQIEDLLKKKSVVETR
jgi:hypothetical protein